MMNYSLILNDIKPRTPPHTTQQISRTIDSFLNLNGAKKVI